MGDNGGSDWGKLRVYQVHYYVLQETLGKNAYLPDRTYAELTDFVVARDEDGAMRRFDRQIRPEIRSLLGGRAELISKATFATEVEVSGYDIKVEEKQKSKTQKPSRLEQSLMDGIEKVE